MGLTDRVPGVLEFDFVSIARPSSNTPPMTPAEFDRCVRRVPNVFRMLPCPFSFSVSSSPKRAAPSLAQPHVVPEAVQARTSQFSRIRDDECQVPRAFGAVRCFMALLWRSLC